MRILQINNVYPDRSTGKITADIHHVLQRDGYESYVLYGRGRKTEESHVWKLCSEAYAKGNVIMAALTGMPYGGCLLSTGRAIRMIRRLHPDAVHLQCINEHFINIYRLVRWLNVHDVPTVLTLHAEFMYTGNCGHAYGCDQWKSGCRHCARFRSVNRSLFFNRTHQSYLKMQEAFRGFRRLRVVSVSPWLERRALSSPILADARHCVILNGVNTDIFHYSPPQNGEMPARLRNRKIILHVTALFRDRKGDPKGGIHILHLARQLEDKDVLVLVAGKCELSSGSLPGNVILLGEVTDQRRLAQYYSVADLTVIASRRETYSMVCAESLCCGTPVIGFRAGAPETVSMPSYSEFTAYGDDGALLACAEKWLRRAQTLDKQHICEEAARRYSREAMTRAYEKLYGELTGNLNEDQ